MDDKSNKGEVLSSEGETTVTPVMVPARHRTGLEPISRLACELEWCLTQVNPQHKVHEVISGVVRQINALPSGSVQTREPPHYLTCNCGVPLGRSDLPHLDGCALKTFSRSCIVFATSREEKQRLLYEAIEIILFLPRIYPYDKEWRAQREEYYRNIVKQLGEEIRNANEN